MLHRSRYIQILKCFTFLNSPLNLSKNLETWKNSQYCLVLQNTHTTISENTSPKLEYLERLHKFKVFSKRIFILLY